MNKSSIVNYINKFLQIGYYLLFLLTPLIMFSKTSELFEFNKMVFIYFISLFIIFFWFLKMIIVQRINLKKTFFVLPFIIFLISQILSTIFSIDRWTSFVGYYGRFNGGLISIIVYLFLFFVFIANFQDFSKKFLDYFLKISLFSSFFVILWGLPGRFNRDLSCYIFTKNFNNSCWTDQFRPSERMFSTLGQPNWLAAYLLINFFIGLYFYFRDNKTNFFYLIYLFFNFSGILLTRSRSSFLAFFVCFGFFLVYLFFQKKYFGKKKVFFLIFLLLISLFIWRTGLNQFDKFLSFNFLISKKKNEKNITIRENKNNRLLQTGVTDSAEIRKIVWKGAIELGKRYPLFGTGVETFGYSYYFVRPKEHNLTSEWDYLYNKAHNEYLNYLATTGFIGLISYLIMIGTTIFLAIKKLTDFYKTKKNINHKHKDDLLLLTDSQWLIFCLLLSYVSILMTNFFGFSTTTVNLFFYIIPGIFFVINKKEAVNKDEDQLFDNQPFSLNQKMYLLFLIIVFNYFLLAILRYWLADFYYARGTNFNQAGQYQLAATEFDKALKLHYEHVYEDKLSYSLANLALIAFYEKEDKLARNLIKTADFYNKKAILASPKNVLYWKTMAKNSYVFYQIDNDINWLKKGLVALEKANQLSPTDPKIFYNLALYYSFLSTEEKDEKFINEALKSINQAIYLKPDFRDGYFLKGQLLKKFNKEKEAKEVFRFILEKINPNDEEAKKELID